MSPETDLAWSAGLYEGEGCVIYGASHAGPLVAKINSTDRDVLDLITVRSGYGRVNGPYPPRGIGRKPFHEWRVNGVAAGAFLVAVRPWLGERRRSQVDAKLVLWHQRPRRQVLIGAGERVAIRARRRQGATLQEIATEFGVKFAYVGQILTGYIHPDEKTVDDAKHGPSTLTRGQALACRRGAT